MPSVCKFCKKALVVIGLDRENGRGTFNDWKDNKYNPREFHKKCFKDFKTIQYCIQLSNN